MVYPSRQYPVQFSPTAPSFATIHQGHSSTPYFDMADICLEWSMLKQTYSCFVMGETYDLQWPLFRVHSELYWLVWGDQQTSLEWMRFTIEGFCSSDFNLTTHLKVTAYGDISRMWIDPCKLMDIPGQEWHDAVICTLKKDCKIPNGNNFHDCSLVFNCGQPAESVIYDMFPSYFLKYHI